MVIVAKMITMIIIFYCIVEMVEKHSSEAALAINKLMYCHCACCVQGPAGGKLPTAPIICCIFTGVT